MAKRIEHGVEQQILKLYYDGLTYEQIAPIVGHHVSTVAAAFRRSGGKARTPNALRTGVKNGRWKGGGRIVNGYRRLWVPDTHRFAHLRSKANCIAEHRLVMMEYLGRELLPTEQVHHINGNKLDNRPENLQLVMGPHGSGIVMCCADCGSCSLKPKEIL